MHESSLGKAVLEAVLERAEAEHASRVHKVSGWIAETESLDPSAIRFHFQAHARGTIAEGAELELRLHWVEAECNACHARYKPEHHLLLCPNCGSTDGKELGQTGLGLDSIVVD